MERAREGKGKERENGLDGYGNGGEFALFALEGIDAPASM